ncbi:carbohydrate-binding domain-containing protein, partial [Roseomonas populi]
FTTAADFTRDPTFSLEAPGSSGTVIPPITEIPAHPGTTPADPVTLPSDPVTTPEHPTAPSDPAEGPATPLPPETAKGVPLSITLGAESWNGNPFAKVMVDGAVAFSGEIAASHASGGIAMVLGTVDPEQAHTVTVEFTNDAWGGSAATDRNLYVEDIRLGEVSSGQDGALLEDGLLTFQLRGTAPASDHAPVAATDQHPIEIGISGDAWGGSPRYDVLLDGSKVISGREATAAHGAGAAETIGIGADLSPGDHVLTVRFLNDASGGSAAADRNLYVDSVVVNGTDIHQQAVLTTNGDAVFHFSTAGEAAAVVDAAIAAVDHAIQPVVTDLGSSSIWLG